MIPIGLRFQWDDDAVAHVSVIDDDREAFAIRDENGAVLVGLRSKTLKTSTLTMSGEAAEALWSALTSALGYEIR